MGGQTTKTDTVQNRDPWGPSQPYLIKGLQEADQIYEAQKAANNPGYTGDFVAQPTSQQTSGAAGLMNWSQGTGMGNVNSQLGMGTALTGLGAMGTQGAISGLNNFANTDPTKANIAAASQYANNPYMDSMVNAATRDATRQFAEQTMPTIDAGAAATGNVNSTRTGIAQGIAQRGLQDTIADTSAQLRGAAYQQGIGAAQQDQANRLSALGQSGQLASGLTNSGIAQTAGGWDAAQKSTDMFNIGNALTTANNQAPIDNALAKLDYQNTQPWANLMQAEQVYNAAGQQGGTTTTHGTQTVTQSPLSTIGSMFGLFGSFMRCDARTKTVLAQVGSLSNGLPVYLYTYRDDPTGQPHMGPMAQDVEAVIPAAVVEINGVKHIDTTALVLALS